MKDKNSEKKGIKRWKLKSSGIFIEKWNKAVKSIFGFAVFGFICICIVGCSQTQSLEKISLSADSEQIYDINHKVDIVLETTPEDCDIPKSAFEVSGGEVDIKNDKITFTSSADGEFDIYVEYSDITSNTITLKFEDKEAIEQAEQERIAAEQAEQERIAAEQAEQERIAAEQAEQERIAAEQAEQERIAAEQAEQERIAAEQAEQARIAAEQAEQARIEQEQSQQTAPIEEMVWLSATGKKYHNKPNCGNMNASQARQVPLSEAALNYGPCKNCYR